MSTGTSDESARSAELERATLDKAERMELLHRVGIALTAEKNRDRLVEMILLEAKQLCNADGGTLYMRTETDTLRFAIMRTDSLAIALGGTTGRKIELPEMPLYDAETGAPNLANVATAAAILKKSINIPDAYDAEGFDFSGTKSFDARNSYRSKSFLTIPLFNTEGRVIAVLQLLNARDAHGDVIPFSLEVERVVEALASQAGIALDNQMLLEGQRKLLEAFIKLIAAAIDAKSPYTGGHCERVPVLTEMIAESLCKSRGGPFADFMLNDDEWYELRIAAWLHDCGKVTTPVHVMDKATKLETIVDRISTVRARFESLRRGAEIAMLKAKLDGKESSDVIEQRYQAELKRLAEDLAFLEHANVGGEFLPPEHQARIREIGLRRYSENGEDRQLLSEDEIENLSISRGTLTEGERLVINGHMVQTVRMLEALPFPRNLARVPEYAAGHHEKMDGGGYPRGIFAGDMSIPARIMAIADVFEALTADDRPYKKAKRLSEAMNIMGAMKRFNHLDPELFDHFVQTRVYLDYARKFLSESLIDEVDEAKLLAIKPEPFELPDDELRKLRWRDFLPAYRAQNR
ncbi:MAG: HD domain-containing phosphohydrolase [Polyangiaceae bacterium]